MTRLMVVVVAVTAMFGSGCLDEAWDSNDLRLDEQEEVAAPTPKSDPAVQDPGTGTAVDHGEPQVSESDGGTQLTQNGGWEARKTVTIQNDFGGASQAAVLIDIGAGGIDFLPDSNGGYLYTIELVARAATEMEAQENLDETVVEHTDHLEADTLHLETRVVPPGTQPMEVAGVQIGQINSGLDIAAYVTAHLPPEVYYEALNLDASSGDLFLRDVAGSSVVLDTSSGDITAERVQANTLSADASSGDIKLSDVAGRTLKVDTSSGESTVMGAFRKVSLDASSGDITYTGRVADMQADTSSGDITLDVVPSASGQFKLDASSGDVKVTVPRAGAEYGYDIEADASSGDVEIDVGDTESFHSDDGNVKARTAGYGQAASQTRMLVDTSSGDITIQAR